jgi:hypothetical protein
MMEDFDEFSRFKSTEETLFDNNETIGSWVQPSFITNRPTDDLIGVFRVSSALEGRPDLISNQLYGTPLLDWVLISFNNARAALNWPRAGESIEYPVRSLVIPEIVG